MPKIELSEITIFYNHFFPFRVGTFPVVPPVYATVNPRRRYNSTVQFYHFHFSCLDQQLFYLSSLSLSHSVKNLVLSFLTIVRTHRLNEFVSFVLLKFIDNLTSYRQVEDILDIFQILIALQMQDLSFFNSVGCVKI